MRPLLVPAVLALGFGVTGCQSVPAQNATATPKSSNQLAVLHTQLGVGYMREDQNERAYNRLQRALKADSGYAPAHNAMALLNERLDEPSKAEHHYRRAVELNPGYSAAQNNYGAFLCRQDRYQEAEERFLKATSNPLYDSPESAYTNAGLCMQKAGDLKTAEEHLRRALQINPRVAPALLSMAEISFNKGNTLSARGYLERYLDVAQPTPRSLWLGIRIERRLGDRDAASSYAMLLKANYPDSHETQLLLESEAQ